MSQVCRLISVETLANQDMFCWNKKSFQQLATLTVCRPAKSHGFRESPEMVHGLTEMLQNLKEFREFYFIFLQKKHAFGVNSRGL